MGLVPNVVLSVRCESRPSAACAPPSCQSADDIVPIECWVLNDCQGSLLPTGRLENLSHYEDMLVPKFIRINVA